MPRPHDWEEAFNDLTDEKDDLYSILEKIVCLWEEESDKAEMENTILKAKHLLQTITKTK